MNKLIQLRSKINKIDKDLIVLLSKRLKVVKEVGLYKKKQNIPPLDNKRWVEVMKSRLQIGSEYELSENIITNLFELIHKEALVIEEKIIHEK